MAHIIKMFLKFGSYHDILDLYENGTIYMNPVQYFRKIEDKELRGDKYEGASEIINSFPGTFRIPGIDRDIPYEKVHLISSYPEVLGNIYSLYCISSFGMPNLLNFRIDKRILRFGSHCLMVKDNAYFLERIRNEFQLRGLNFDEGFVRYYDRNTISKKLTYFDKPSEFEYQKEFRFYIENQDIAPIKIDIGSLTNYSEILPIKQIFRLRFEVGNKFRN